MYIALLIMLLELILPKGNILLIKGGPHGDSGLQSVGALGFIFVFIVLASSVLIIILRRRRLRPRPSKLRPQCPQQWQVDKLAFVFPKNFENKNE